MLYESDSRWLSSWRRRAKLDGKTLIGGQAVRPWNQYVPLKARYVGRLCGQVWPHLAFVATCGHSCGHILVPQHVATNVATNVAKNVVTNVATKVTHVPYLCVRTDSSRLNLSCCQPRSTSSVRLLMAAVQQCRWTKRFVSERREAAASRPGIFPRVGASRRSTGRRVSRRYRKFWVTRLVSLTFRNF